MIVADYITPVIMFLNQIGSFGLSPDRLPWSTMESYLEDRGMELVNWPAGVPRTSDGIQGLSAEHADKLYCAITHSDKKHRLIFRLLDKQVATGMS